MVVFEQKYIRRYGRFYQNARKYASKKEVLISTYLIISLFTISFFAAVFIRPTAVTIAKIWREIQDKKGVYSQLESKIKDLEKAQAIYLDIKDDLIHIERAIPTNPAYEKFLKQIEYLAYSRGVVINSSQYEGIQLFPIVASENSAPEVVIHGFTMNISGNIGVIKDFLSDLIKFDRLITIESIKISPPKDTNQSSYSLTVALQSQAYSFPELDISEDYQ